jgi:hypothetical protein
MKKAQEKGVTGSQWLVVPIDMFISWSSMISYCDLDRKSIDG